MLKINSKKGLNRLLSVVLSFLLIVSLVPASIFIQASETAMQTISFAQLALGYSDVVGKVAVPKENITLVGYAYAADGSTSSYNVENSLGNIYFQAPNVAIGHSFEFNTPISIDVEDNYTGELRFKRNTNRGTYDVELISTLNRNNIYKIGSIDESGSDSMANRAISGDPICVPAGTYTIRFVCTKAGTLTLSELYLTGAPEPMEVAHEPAYGEKDGIIVINAADAIENNSYAMHDNTTSKTTGISGLNFAWEVTETFQDVQMGIEHKGIQLLPIRNSSEYDSAISNNWLWSNASDAADAPRLSYKVSVEKAGDYYFSFYSNSPNDGADSFHISVNGEYQFRSMDQMSGGSDANHAMVGACWFYCDRATLPLKAGVNTITISGRESGVLLRQIMLTKNKPMEASYLYHSSQKNSEWLKESDIVTGRITLTNLADVDLGYAGQKIIPISALASNGEDVTLNVTSSMDAVTVSAIENGQFTINAQKSGYSTITVTATANNCTTVTETFFVNVASRRSGVADTGAPQNLIVAPASETQDSIAIVWDKPEDYYDVTGYNVYMGGQKVATKAHNKTYYTAMGLEADREYAFCVEAVYSDGKIASSETMYAATDPQGAVIDITAEPYGAIGNGVAMNTEKIQKAIADCPKGGTVLVPAGGVFLTGALDLKSHMTLKVEGELKGSANPNDYLYPDVPWDDDDFGQRILTRYEGWELLCHRSLLNAGQLNWRNREEVTCEDLTISGSGKITGGGTALRDATIEFASRNGWVVGTTNIYERTRGRLISMIQCKSVNLTGVHISESPCWTVHMIYSDTITTHSVEIYSKVLNGDGWDPDSSRNLMLFDSKIETGDDCVAIKSGKNPEGNRVNIPTENVKIFDIECGGRGHGLAMGSEISGGINNISIRDCVVRNTIYGLQLKGSEKRGGGITNLNIQDCTFNLLLIKSNVSYNADGDSAADVPLFNNLSFRNVIIEGTNIDDYSVSNYDNVGAIEIAGFNKTNCHNHFVNNVLFKDVTLGTEKNPLARVIMEYCDGITFENVKKYDGTNPDYIMNNVNKNILVEEDTIPKFTSSIEAENMGKIGDTGTGYNFMASNAASGGFCQYVRLGDSGTLAAQYDGPDGFASFNVDYIDQAGGSATYKFYINDTFVSEWNASADTGAGMTKTINNVILQKGDIIKIVGNIDGSDKAQLDKLSISSIESSDVMISDVETDEHGSLTAVSIMSRNQLSAAGKVVAKVYNKDDKNGEVIRTVEEILQWIGNSQIVTFSESVTVAVGQYYVIHIQDGAGNDLCKPYIMPQYISTDITMIEDEVILNAPKRADDSIKVAIGATVAKVINNTNAKLGGTQTYTFYVTEEDANNNINALANTDILWNGYYMKIIAEDGETTALYLIEVKQTINFAQLAVGYSDVALGKVAVPKENITLVGYPYAANGSISSYNVENSLGTNIYFQAPNVAIGQSFEFNTPITIGAGGNYIGELRYKRNTNRGTFDIELVSTSNRNNVYKIGSIDENGVDSMANMIFTVNPVEILAGTYTIRFVCTRAGTLTASELYLTGVAGEVIKVEYSNTVNLQKLYNEYKNIKNSVADPYTDESWNAFVKAMASAKVFLDDKPLKSEQAKVDAAYRKLADAYKNLKKPVKVSGISISHRSASLVKGKTLTLKGTISPSNAFNKGVTWTSSNDLVASVNTNGKVTAKKAGTATITVKAKDGSNKYNKCVITVYAKATKVTVKAAGYTLKNSTIYLVKGKSVKLVSTVSPSKAQKGVTYKSNTKSIAKVSSVGNVKAQKAGSAIVTITSKDGIKKKNIKIVVVNKAQKNTRLKVSKKNISLAKKGIKATISATVLKNTTEKVTFKSNNNKIAKVNSYGVITAVKKGKTTITVKCGKKVVTVKVTVKR